MRNDLNLAYQAANLPSLYLKDGGSVGSNSFGDQCVNGVRRRCRSIKQSMKFFLMDVSTKSSEFASSDKLFEVLSCAESVNRSCVCLNGYRHAEYVLRSGS